MKKCTIYGNGSESVITKMFYCEVEKGAYVFRQNDQASCFFIIHEGEVTVEINKQEKQDKKILKKKSCFGDLALMYNATRSASIFANETTRFWAIDRRTFKKVVEEVATTKFKENREFIEKVPFFDSMTDSQKDAVTMVLLTQAFKKGQVIINEGDQAASYYIIKEVDRCKQGSADCVNNKGVVVRTLQSGESFGEQALYETGTRTLTVRAASDCKCLALSRGDLQNIMGSKIQQVIQANWTRWAIEKDPVLQRLTKLQIERLIQNSEVRKLTGGDILQPKNAPLSTIYIVINGSLRYDTQFAKGTVFASSFLHPHANTSHRLLHDLRVDSGGAEAAVIDVARFEQVIGPNLEVVFENNLHSHELKMMDDGKQYREKVANLQLKDLIFIKKLGEGQFGQVFLVKGTGKNDFYALKAISKKQIIAENLEKHILQEREVLQLVNFPFIMRMYRTFKDDNFVYFLLSYVQGLELFDVMRELGSIALLDILSNEDSQFYIGSMILAVEYLHKKKIVYRDIKPENIIIDEQGYLKLIDMGTAKVLRSENGICRTTTTLGTPHYMAPEILKGKGYGLNVDLWSIGICLYEFLCGFVPFGEECDDPQEVYELIGSKVLSFPDFFDIPENKVAKKFIEQLLNRSPEARLGGSYASLKANRWFERLDWDKLLDKSLPKVPFVQVIPSSFTQDVEDALNMNRSVTTEIDKMSAKFMNPTLKKSLPSSTKSLNWDRDF